MGSSQLLLLLLLLLPAFAGHADCNTAKKVAEPTQHLLS
jgi:hypothetical protein